ncbi:hypothetical protein [Endozoicomonas sp. SESOKO1]|uniref:hypothetical protein n=1 Tax=Endozoicomonas sp. SESOKO1 TaxID=2828742 RepID=UPI0021493FA7|nr:hypothetical protein [Endozoicomonas sp. SESOKO1]
MKKEKKFWHMPQFIHGKGHDFYDSKEAKQLYAKQLVSLSEKVFWAMIAPFFCFFLNPEKVDVCLVACSSLIFLLIGLYFRHQGLKIIDELELEEIEIVVPKSTTHITRASSGRR